MKAGQGPLDRRCSGMKNRIRSFRKVMVLFLAGLLATQLSLTALADTAAGAAAADHAGTDVSSAVPGPTVETFTLGSLMVEVEAVDVPTAATGLTYNGKEQEGVSLRDPDKRYKLRSGANTAVKPGDYAAELELAEPLPDNIAQQIREGKAVQGMPATPSDYSVVRFYIWKDRTTAPVTIRWSIAALKAKVPEGQKLSYNGKEQTGVAEGSGYTLSGNKAVKPGSYKAAARLAEGYAWEDGTVKDQEIAWSIEALKAKAPEGKKLTYTGKELTGVEAPENCGYTLSGNKETKAGSYKAVAKLAEGYVWEDGTVKDLEIEWSIVRKSSGGGDGGSSGTGQKGLMVVRPDGSVSTYGSTGAGSSNSGGSSSTSAGTYAGNPPGQPAGTTLVQNDPSVPSPEPGSLSGTSVPPASKLPQVSGAASATQNTDAAGSKNTPKSSGSTAGSQSGTKKADSPAAAEKPAASAASEVSKEHAETEETKAGTANETLVAAEENSVVFEFGPAIKEGEKDISTDNTGTPAVQKPESFAAGLMSVVWKILAVLGVLAIAGGTGYMIYNRKRDKWDE